MARDCAYCASPSSSLKCSSCKSVYYCGRDCQGKDWKDHKEVCATVPRVKVNEQVASGPEKNTLNSPKKLCILCSKVAVSRCGACKEVFYCGRNCQAQHWTKGHKSTCGATANDCPASQPGARERVDKNDLATVKPSVTHSGTPNGKTVKRINSGNEREGPREQAEVVEVTSARRKQNRRQRQGDKSTQPKEIKVNSVSSTAGSAEWHEGRMVSKESTERGTRKQTKASATPTSREGAVSSQPFHTEGQRTITFKSSQGEAKSHRKGVSRSKQRATPSHSSTAPPHGKQDPIKKENKQRQSSAGSIEASKPLIKEKKDEKKDRRLPQNEGKGLKWIQKTTSGLPTKEMDLSRREKVLSSRDGETTLHDSRKIRLSNATSTEMRQRRRGSVPDQAVASGANRAARSMTVPPPTSNRPPVSQRNHGAPMKVATPASNEDDSDPFEAVIRAALTQTQHKATRASTEYKVASVCDADVPHVTQEQVKDPEVVVVDGTAHETSTAQNEEDTSGDIFPQVAEVPPTTDKEADDDASLTLGAEEVTNGDEETDDAVTSTSVAEKAITDEEAEGHAEVDRCEGMTDETTIDKALECEENMLNSEQVAAGEEPAHMDEKPLTNCKDAAEEVSPTTVAEISENRSNGTLAESRTSPPEPVPVVPVTGFLDDWAATALAADNDDVEPTTDITNDGREASAVDDIIGELSKNAKKKKKRRAKKKAAMKKTVNWGLIAVQEYTRQISGGGGVPLYGTWALGLGQRTRSYDLGSVDEFEARRLIALDSKTKHLPEAARKLANGETRQFDYSAGRSNPLFKPLTEEEREKLFLAALKDVTGGAKADDTKKQSQKRNSHRRPRSGSMDVFEIGELTLDGGRSHEEQAARDEAKQEYQELHAIRESRRDHSGCACKHLKPSKWNLKQLRDALKQKGLSTAGSKAELVARFKAATPDVPLCGEGDNTCECEAEGIPCHYQLCHCLHGNSNACRNPYGHTEYSFEKVKTYRKLVFSALRKQAERNGMEPLPQLRTPHVAGPSLMTVSAA